MYTFDDYMYVDIDMVTWILHSSLLSRVRQPCNTGNPRFNDLGSLYSRALSEAITALVFPSIVG